MNVETNGFGDGYFLMFGGGSSPGMMLQISCSGRLAAVFTTRPSWVPRPAAAGRCFVPL